MTVNPIDESLAAPVCHTAQGAAVVRMFRFLLGPSGFTDGVKAFFDSNDGKVSVLTGLNVLLKPLQLVGL